jgi:hypothetical protein
MHIPRYLSTLARGIRMDLTFWFVIIIGSTTSLPIQKTDDPTLDEILQSGEYI